MAYREPTAGLLARIAQLELQLKEVLGDRDRAGGGALAVLLGAPLRVQLERTLPLELEPEKHDLVVEALQRRFDAQGQFLAVGRSCHWSLLTSSSQRDVNVSLVVRGGTTTVRVSERFKHLLGMCFAWVYILGFPLAMAIPALLRSSRVTWPAVWALLALSGVAAIRVAYSRIARARERRLRATLQELAEISTSKG
ncbi:MAG: hypothetical protein HS104_22350 [Polyangiaceae bacterium]|nr:hypothetical protein [Polyangiaceae bacterium]MCE7891092.1 hypothetical protein [Sorangiineae bacterium PRO1]MCL4750030.1 hypothetical protein [Myxococcales bacterium]